MALHHGNIPEIIDNLCVKYQISKEVAIYALFIHSGDRISAAEYLGGNSKTKPWTLAFDNQLRKLSSSAVVLEKIFSREEISQRKLFLGVQVLSE